MTSRRFFPLLAALPLLMGAQECGILAHLSTPAPRSPSKGDRIKQNNAITGCPFHPQRGHGFAIRFSWEPAPSDRPIERYELQWRRGEFTGFEPVVATTDKFYDFVACQAFVIDANLEGWFWRVRAVDVDGKIGHWSPLTEFAFAPCRLAGGGPCFAT